MKYVLYTLILVIFTYTINFLSNSNFTIIIQDRPIITNIKDGSYSTLRHESMHLIWNNLSKEDRNRAIEYIKKQEFLGKNAYNFVKDDIIGDTKIYKFQSLFRPSIIDEEVFAYYWQMRL